MRPEVEFLIACGALDDLLEGEEAAQLEAARAADPDVAARIAELEAAYAELGELTEVAPSDALWARIAGSVEAGERFADEAEVPPRRGPDRSPRCALLPRRPRPALGRLLRELPGPHHRECFAEHGRCSAPGCGRPTGSRAGAEVQRPQRRAPRLPLLLGALGLGSAAAALWFGAQVPSAQLADAPVSVAAPPPAPVPPGAPAREGGPRVLSVRGLDVSLDQGSADGIRLGERYALTPVVPADGLYAAT
ncbi:MAG: hypothetical protein R3F62_28775 [Planctomycetota bacterium]